MGTVKFETCSRCGSVDVKNNVYIKRGEPMRIYVECAKCGSFIARYTLTKYTSDKPYESLLKNLRKERFLGSRSAAKIIEEFSVPVSEAFEHIKKLRETLKEKRKVEEIIVELEKT
ncbi:hypothetical protein CH333_05740 [candidate division WOR-3 bacterium JGI_Cruoil_03_44_89]|uniref:Uncharacterized protein n=1 Tax=candidate division WOR-3 bacterium JGI_Cruoil_03_44_89 TaxID=1973748 RepID=A0A235BT71_UNCW3|nr:MAG: hypothetical protein CH333_05740 [candidate division WOR-3 bacterium JGI_Cruoil_03_44_89]